MADLNDLSRVAGSIDTRRLQGSEPRTATCNLRVTASEKASIAAAADYYGVSVTEYLTRLHAEADRHRLATQDATQPVTQDVTPKRKGPRPGSRVHSSDESEEKRRRLLELLSGGMTKKAACEEMGIDRTLPDYWRRSDPDFAEQYKATKAKGKQ